MRTVLFITVILCLLVGLEPAFSSASETSPAFRSTSYPLPRFVSLGSDEVYVRSGPGSRYPVKWVYKKKALPVEVVLEYEIWRKIKDIDGETGWVHQSLISGKRTGLIAGTENVYLYAKPKEGRKNAILQPKTLVDIKECQEGWCEIAASGYDGWIERKNLWGVYETENF